MIHEEDTTGNQKEQTCRRQEQMLRLNPSSIPSRMWIGGWAVRRWWRDGCGVPIEGKSRKLGLLTDDAQTSHERAQNHCPAAVEAYFVV